MIRRFPIGAEPHPEGGVHFRIWAPKAHTLYLVLNDHFASPVRLQPESDGYWSALLTQVRACDKCQFQINDDTRWYPDPASRYQPEGASCAVLHCDCCLVELGI